MNTEHLKKTPQLFFSLRNNIYITNSSVRQVSLSSLQLPLNFHPDAEHSESTGYSPPPTQERLHFMLPLLLWVSCKWGTADLHPWRGTAVLLFASVFLKVRVICPGAKPVLCRPCVPTLDWSLSRRRGSKGRFPGRNRSSKWGFPGRQR